MLKAEKRVRNPAEHIYTVAIAKVCKKRDRKADTLWALVHEYKSTKK